ncbi:Protein CBG26828 [Caenorhabditis briggsae]|nr:Protein CBG26828 [Caenorhabditis briggsae]CAS00367.1 Protein CBG26828 [Caenorhabditis briggsae]
MVLQKQILDEKTPQQLIKLSQKSPNDASIVRRYARGKNTHIKLKISKDVEMTVHLGEWKLTLQMNKKPVFSIEDDGDSRKTKNQAKKFLKPNLENWEFSSPDQNSSTATARVSFASQLETIATFHLELLARTFGVKTIDFECNLDYLETDNTNHQMASNLSMFIITKLGVRYRKFVWPSFPIFYKVLKHLVKNNTEFHVTVAKLNGVQLGKLIATWQRSGSAKEIRLEGIRGTIGDVLKCIDVAEYQNGIVEIERFDGVKAILKLDGGKFSLQVHT